MPEPFPPNGHTMPRLAIDLTRPQATTHSATCSPDRPADVTEPEPLLGLSPVERAAFDLIAGVADRTLARLRIGERRRVWGHLARLCGDLAAD